MDSLYYQDYYSDSSDWIKENYKGLKRFLLILYWLAGVRRSVILYLPESERERLAVIGSSVIIPTVMAFIGMYLFASSMVHPERTYTIIIIATVWAFIIMNVDRLLLATYRPFQKLHRKSVQVLFRICLAAVISVAIALPFCLDQYNEAIQRVLKEEYRAKQNEVQTRYEIAQKQIMARYGNNMDSLKLELAKELEDGPVNALEYAKVKLEQDVIGQQEAELDQQKAREQAVKEARAACDSASEELAKIERDIIDEKNGKLSPEQGGTGLSGEGPRYKALLRKRNILKKAEEAAIQHFNQLTDEIINSEPDRETNPAAYEDKETSLFIRGQERQARIENIKKSIDDQDKAQSAELKRSSSRYLPTIKYYQEKIDGNFDLMEKSLGLYKVIFYQDGNPNDNGANKYKWIPGLFQFATVFGTIFLLDLIAILSKVLSRPGPYDALVEFSESVSNRNIRAFNKEYARYAEKWAGNTSGAEEMSREQKRKSIYLWDYPKMAQYLLRAHTPDKAESKYKINIPGKSSYDEPDNGDGSDGKDNMP